MIRIWFGIFAAVLLSVMFASSSGLCVQQDEDLGLIPDNVLSQSAEQASAAEPEKYRFKIYLDEAATANIKRKNLAVPVPSSDDSGWNNRLSLDVKTEIIFSPNLSFIMADRLHYLLEENMEESGGRIQNDLKELYVTGNSYQFLYLDFGRVNFKNGVAVGFNPTDYFKKNAVSYRISEDPNLLRENRLGVVMARAQGIWEKGSVTLALAPEINQDPDTWWTDADSYGLRLDKTNISDRFLSKITLNAFPDFNPEFLYFYDSDRSNFGANLTKGIGDAAIVYLEWSGSRRPDIFAQSLTEAQESGAIPRNSPWVIDSGRESHFQNQLAIGFSYTEKVNRTTFVEYHFNEAGFTQADWDNWFNAGKEAGTLLQNPATEALGTGMLGQLWTTRKWSQEAQEPLSRHSIFIRTFWEDALIHSLDLTGITRISLLDGSFFAQPMAEYHIRKNLTLSLSVNLFIGSDETEYGSVNPKGDVKAGATCYF
jgi:hypothetical protein